MLVNKNDFLSEKNCCDLISEFYSLNWWFCVTTYAGFVSRQSDGWEGGGLSWDLGNPQIYEIFEFMSFFVTHYR